MSTITQIEVQEIQNRFKSHLDDFLNQTYRCKVQLDDNGLVYKAKLNTHEALTRKQLDLLGEVADAYNLDYEISRSGLGLRIAFTLKIQE